MTRKSKGALLQALVLFLAVWCRPAGAQNLTQVEEEEEKKEFNSGRYFYEYGKFPDAISKFRGMLYPLRLRNETRIIEARKMLGVSCYLTGEVKCAEHEFTKLLLMKPDYNLDPFLIPPQIVEFFDSIRAGMKGKIENPPPVNADHRDEKPELRKVKENIFLLNLMPFGTGQFQNRSTGLGVFFLSSQAVALGVNMVSFALIETRRDPQTGAFAGKSYDEAKTLQKTQFIAIGVFGALYAWSVIDAIVKYQPEVEIEAENGAEEEESH